MASAARADKEARAALARRSRLWFATFAAIFSRALTSDFHAVRLARDGPAPDPETPHLLVYCNHPSWWDAAIITVLIARLFPGRPGFAPIDQTMIARYGFMQRIGAFGVAQNAPAGAAMFLTAAAHILSDRRNLIFVTAQGRFADARERPVRLAPGLAHLVDRAPKATFVPLAIEYPFWDERKPELLLRFGVPFPARDLLGLSRRDRQAQLATRLEQVMDDLARQAIARDATVFTTVLSGRTGVGGIYDLWRRGRALARGEHFVAAHGKPS